MATAWLAAILVGFSFDNPVSSNQLLVFIAGGLAGGLMAGALSAPALSWLVRQRVETAVA